MEILTLSDGFETPLLPPVDVREVHRQRQFQAFVDAVTVSYERHAVRCDWRKSVRLVKDDLNRRGHNTTCGQLEHIIRAELKRGNVK